MMLACTLNAQRNVDSLFYLMETRSGKHKSSVSYELANYFIQNELCDYPKVIHPTDNKKYVESVAYQGMASYCYEKGDFQRTLQYAFEALNLVPSTVDSLPYFNVACYEVIEAAYFRLGQYDKSLQFAEKHYKVSKQLKDNAMESSALNTYSAIYLVTEKLKDAEKYARQAIDIERKLNDDKSLAIRLGMMSDIKLKQRKPDEALKYIEEALEIDRKAGRIDKVGVRLSQKADICMAKNDWVLCRKLLLEAKDIFKKTDNIVSYAITLKQLGRTEMKLNHPDQAEKYMLEGVRICEDIGFKQILQILYSELSDLYRETDPRKALNYFEKSANLKDTLHSEEQMKQLNEFKIRYETQEKENQLSLQQIKNKRRMNMIIILIFCLLLTIVFLVETIFLNRIRKKRNAELEEMNETKNKFFSIVSHDLKNPVIAQKQMLDLLNTNFDSIPSQEMKECIYQMKLSNDSLNRLLKDLLQWVSLESGRMVYTPTRIDLKKLVEDVLAQQKSQAQNKNISVVHNIKDDCYVTEDKNFMEFILRNFLSNAVKFSYPDGLVRIEYTCDKGQCILSVVDQGIGMSASQCEKLFKSRAVSQNGTNGEPGTGLGMLLCKEIADKGGNTLYVQSEQGKGTTVSLSVTPSAPTTSKNYNTL